MKLQSVFFVPVTFLLDKMNRKTVPVSSSALRRRTHIDVYKQRCTNLSDFQMTTEMDLVDVNIELESTDNPACSDISTELFFSEEEGGVEIDAHVHEGFVVGSYDRSIQSSDSENSDDELAETFSLSDSIFLQIVFFFFFLQLQKSTS